MPASTAATPLPLSAYADQLHHFNDDFTVKTERQPNGQYTAIDADNYEPGFPVGWGPTRFSAIADLTEIMTERETRGDAGEIMEQFDAAIDAIKQWVEAA